MHDPQVIYSRKRSVKMNTAEGLSSEGNRKGGNQDPLDENSRTMCGSWQFAPHLDLHLKARKY